MLREEIKSTCNNHPFEKCDYVPRISNEICCKKLEYVIAHLDGMQHSSRQLRDMVMQIEVMHCGIVSEACSVVDTLGNEIDYCFV